jgi:hypothetical protein
MNAAHHQHELRYAKWKKGDQPVIYCWLRPRFHFALGMKNTIH